MCQPDNIEVVTLDEKQNKQQIVTNIVHIVEILFGFYIIYFLLFLNFRFGRDGDLEMQDEVLDRKVSNFVFIMNSKLLKDAFKEKLQITESQKQEILLKAQVNDYMNTMLQNNGICIKNDEAISKAFLDLSFQVAV